MKFCVYCGKPIKEDEAWTEDPTGSGCYWHFTCHAKAVKQWLGIPVEERPSWKEYAEKICEEGKRRGMQTELPRAGESEVEVKRISLTDVFFQQLKDLDRISHYWFKFVVGEITADQLWEILLEPSYAAKARAKAVPEYRSLFLAIADQIKRFREALMKYKDKKIDFGELANEYRKLRDYYLKVSEAFLETFAWRKP